MRYRIGIPALFLALLAAGLALPACAPAGEGIPISPTPIEQRPEDFGLGPGVRPLSSGPGDKSSPSWSPSGERLAFIVDGYVVEKEVDAFEGNRQTTRDFGARRVAWLSSEDRLSVTAAPGTVSSPTGSPLRTVYLISTDEALFVDRVASSTSAISTFPDGALLLAQRTGASKSRLAVARGGAVTPYGPPIEGEVTAVSVAPEGDRAIISVRKPGPAQTFEVLSYSFPENRLRKLAELQEGLRIFGAPQLTGNGIYYVAGREVEAGDEARPNYSLYRLAPKTYRPELAPGIGAGFIAASLKRSPNGERLAVIGRRNSSSPINLYVLRPGVGNLVAATNNENMEIKTGTEDLAWSNDGGRVAIVARSTVSEPKVYDKPADALVSDFYNVYSVPVDGLPEKGAS